jgi:tRNA (guanine26-N2/guanine27-N2)-dimethyltransferase
MAAEALQSPASVSSKALRQLERLASDPGSPARSWPSAEIGRQLGSGPPRLADLVEVLRAAGHGAAVSGIMPSQLRSDAPWPLILGIARTLANRTAAK